MLRRIKLSKGFTLVELLIVVAIIGVLSTIGIPTFKRMVQKAKKSEAKVALGGLYTAEAAFFAEYGAYGSNIDKIGFDMQGTNLIYAVGFPSTACVGQGAHQPPVASGPGSSINSAFPAFFDTEVTTAGSEDNRWNFGARGGAQTACAQGTLGLLGETFEATATGMIAPGVALDDTGSADIWTMNHNRQLANTQDGVM